MSADPVLRLPAAFGNLLSRWLRNERRLTYQAAAAALDLPDQVAVVEMECGGREPTLRQIFKLAAALGDPPDILLVDVLTEWIADMSKHLISDVEIAIQGVRDSLIEAASIRYRMHSIMRCQQMQSESEVSKVVEDAAKWSDCKNLSEMLLAKFVTVLKDEIARGVINIDPEDVEKTETAGARVGNRGGAK